MVMSRVLRPVIIATGLLLVLAACGDDDATTDPDGLAGDTMAWCGAVVEFDDFLSELPIPQSDDEVLQQVEQIIPRFSVLAGAAPAGVRDVADLLLDGFETIAAGDDTPMFDPQFNEAFLDFEDFVLDVCDYQMDG